MKQYLYLDGTVFTESGEDLQQIVNEFVRVFNRMGLKIYCGKSTVLVIRKDQRISGERI